MNNDWIRRSINYGKMWLKFAIVVGIILTAMIVAAVNWLEYYYKSNP